MSSRPVTCRRLVIFALTVVATLALAGCGPLLDQGAFQEQAEQPLEQLAEGRTLVQTFTASQPGLTAVEVLLAAYSTEGDPEGDLVISLRPADGDVALGSVSQPVASVQHNSRVRLAVPPQGDSAGRQYELVVETSSGLESPATVWAGVGNAYVGGDLRLDGQPLDADLTFRAYYDYGAGQFVNDLARATVDLAWPLIAVLLVLIVPGFAMEHWLLRGLNFDVAEALGAWVGLSLAFWSVIFLFASTAGLSLGPPAATAVVLLAGLVGLARVGGDLRGRPRPGKPSRRRLASAAWTPAGGALVVALGALSLRYVHAKDLALPTWVDSVHHTLIAGLIAAEGRLPENYGPLIPDQPYTYHFGFHLPVVLLKWFTGFDLAQGVLLVGQLLGGLAVFSTYLLASRMVGDRRAGLVAGLVVGLLSTMPAYYVSWGRYPQLAGLVALPVGATLAGELWDARWRSPVLPLAILAVAGVVLIHPRVAVVLASLLAADAISRLVSRRRSLARLARPAMGYGTLALGTAIVLAPWLDRLSSSTVAGIVGLAVPLPGPDFAQNILAAGFPGAVDRYLLAAAATAVVLGLARRRRFAAVGVLWLALSVIAARPSILGLPIDLILSAHALGIALFLPVAVLVGALASELWQLLSADRWPSSARGLLVVPLAVAGMWGGANLAGIVNPTCLLATEADVEALHWVRTNTPTDASFLINGRRWQGSVSAGTDAGYWLPALAGRRTSLPPLPYAHGSAEEVGRIEDLADRVAQTTGMTTDDLRGVMVEDGLTHVFIGEMGGPLEPETFLASPAFRLEFSNGRAWVFARVD